MPSRPIFGTGLARSGGGLYSLCLSTHPQIMVACCPNLELFRSFRNAVLRQHGEKDLRHSVHPDAALQDYYGTDDRIRALDLMLDADLDTPFDPDEWPRFHATSVARGRLESADLVAHYHRLKADTYAGIFRNLLNIISHARQSHDRQWVGLHEVWVLDAYPALARTFRDARFLIMFRDPRAIVSSMLGVEGIDRSQVAQIVSYIRHWRKYVALAQRFAAMPLFKGRLYVTAHDLLVTRPRETIASICTAFDLELDERMLSTENYYNFATGTIWSGNSSFEQKTEGISAHRARRWKNKLPPSIVSTIEYLCGPELKFVGYPAVTPAGEPAAEADGAVIGCLMEDLARQANWRSDLSDSLLDLGLESVRRQLLRVSTPSTDASLVRRCFLFEDTYRALRAGEGPLLPGLAGALN